MNLRKLGQWMLGLFVLWAGCATALVAAPSVNQYGKLPEDIFPDLKNVLNTAMQQSPRVLINQLRKLEAEARAQASRSNIYPNVHGHANLHGNLEDRSDLKDLQTRTNTVFGVSASQGLYHWGALEAQREIGRLRYELETGNTHLAYLELAKEIRTAYLTLVMDKMLLDQAKTNIEISQAFLKRDEENYQKKLISEEQWQSLQLNHRETILLQQRTQTQVENRLQLFRILTGIENFSMDRLPQFYPEVVVDQEAVQSLKNLLSLLAAETGTPTQRYELELAIQREEQKILEANLLPKVNLEAGITQDFLTAANSDANVRRLIFFAGVRVNWHIFDGFRTRHDKVANLKRIQRLEAELTDLVATRASTGVSLLNELDYYSQALDIQQERFHLQLKEFERAERELKEGRLSQAGFLQAAYTFQGQRVALAEARMNYLNQWVEFISFFELDPAVNKY